MKLLKKFRIGSKLMLFVTTAFIITIASLVSITLVQFNNYSNAINQEQAVKGMEALHQKIDGYKTQSLQLARIISSNTNVVKSIQERDSEELHKILDLIADDANIDFITVTDNNGVVLIRTHDPKKVGDNVANQTNVQRALGGEFYSTVEEGSVVKLSARSGVPVINEEGNVVGVISTGYALDKLEILDEAKEIYKTDLTIFLGDVRFNTTIIQDGNRLVGTKLDSRIAEKILEQNKKHIGDAEILGMPFITAYMPLINAEEESVGVIFAGQEKANAIKASNKIAFTVISISIGALLILALLLYLFTVRSISKPLSKVVVAANKICQGDLNIGDLDFHTDYDTKDEVAILGKSFKAMSDNINEAIMNINSSAEQVATGSNQVSVSAQTLSQGATEQASAIEEITSSITQVASQTKENAANANEVNALTIGLKNNAVSGNQQMKEMLKAMKEVNHSSSDIAKIIKVIDEIAFQTNILALNAAVEAARAGQHGKGFAVVAEEVRNLAAKSANAAKETTAMIDGSIDKVGIGTKIANETANALNKIVADITKAAQLIEGIAGASNEQAVGIEQVNKAIDEVAQVVQTNSATAEESAAASEELSGQAELLKLEVSKFNLKNISNIPQSKSDDLIPQVIEDTLIEQGSKRKISLSDREFGKY